MDPNGSEALIEYALVPHIFPPVWIPNWCGLSGTNPMGRYLPCKPPPCKKCFNTQAFAQKIDSEAVPNESAQSKYHGECAHVVGDGLQAGGINARVELAGNYGPVLLQNNFKIVDYISQPAFHSQHAGELGDITIFGIVSGHKYYDRVKA
jgi:hypothetical protein